MNRPKVYIAGPYTKGDVAQNVRRAIVMANRFLEEGADPYVPHLTHFWHMMFEHHYEDWMMLDASFLKICDAVYRLNGESSGADREVELAKQLGIPVLETFIDYCNWRDAWVEERRGNA